MAVQKKSVQKNKNKNKKNKTEFLRNNNLRFSTQTNKDSLLNIDARSPNPTYR